jgi:hypothetical protein
VQEVAQRLSIYRQQHNPFRLEGQKTMSYCAEGLAAEVPDWIVVRRQPAMPRAPGKAFIELSDWASCVVPRLGVSMPLGPAFPCWLRLRPALPRRADIT